MASELNDECDLEEKRLRELTEVDLARRVHEIETEQLAAIEGMHGQTQTDQGDGKPFGTTKLIELTAVLPANENVTKVEQTKRQIAFEIGREGESSELPDPSSLGEPSMEKPVIVLEEEVVVENGEQLLSVGLVETSRNCYYWTASLNVLSAVEFWYYVAHFEIEESCSWAILVLEELAFHLRHLVSNYCPYPKHKKYYSSAKLM